MTRVSMVPVQEHTISQAPCATSILMHPANDDKFSFVKNISILSNFNHQHIRHHSTYLKKLLKCGSVVGMECLPRALSFEILTNRVQDYQF